MFKAGGSHAALMHQCECVFKEGIYFLTSVDYPEAPWASTAQYKCSRFSVNLFIYMDVCTEDFEPCARVSSLESDTDSHMNYISKQKQKLCEKI